MRSLDASRGTCSRAAVALSKLASCGLVDAREKRLAQNEILFREINERIEGIAEVQGADDHVFDFICECPDAACTLRLPLTLKLYEDTRADPTAFIVAPGHDCPEIEDVALRGPGFQVVRKVGIAGALAREEDPRDEN
jgi:hypothetical protein